jgi:hypothetical protein
MLPSPSHIVTITRWQQQGDKDNGGDSNGGGGELQQTTKKGTTKTVMVTEMAAVTCSNDNKVDANANNNS